jgi:alkanesulfonate monooxygenase SsuD/methylene tetrahydromethanopterin reductase-like flavin-dependent oxidoreductase (luciferase family)
MPPTLTVIWWRDIPAQVVAKDGRRAAKVMLRRRFQVAIDRAAVRSGRKEMDAYVAEWRREARRCGEDLEAEVRAEAERLETDYPNERLKRLYENGGLADGDGLVPPPPATPFWPVSATDQETS